MKIKKAYKYRFYPTHKQIENLAQTFGCCRFVYNTMLDFRDRSYREKQKKVDYCETSKRLSEMKRTEKYSWLKDVSSVPLQQSLRHLQTAFVNFWSGRAKHPTFKKKQNKQSATYAKSAFKWDGKSLTLAKQSEPLDISFSRGFSGNPTTITVSKDTANRYFVSFLVEEVAKPKKRLKKKVGIDLGIKDVVVGSDGFKSGSPKFTQKYATKLARAQRKLSKKKKGSKNRAKARHNVAKIHAKIADCRRDFLHKLSTKLINENQVIATETLAVKNMVKNHCLSKAIHDSSWGELLRQLAYKAQWYGRKLIGIDRWFPSSKRCSKCGWINDRLKLEHRNWICKSCKTRHDRDVNASKNILAVGQAVSAFGENVRDVSKLGISCSQ